MVRIVTKGNSSTASFDEPLCSYDEPGHFYVFFDFFVFFNFYVPGRSVPRLLEAGSQRSTPPR